MKPFLRILLPAAVCGLLLGACTQRQTTLKFMSYNIRNGRGIDNVQDLGRVAEIINRTAPDIVALQELDSVTGRMPGTVIPGQLGEMTGHARPFLPRHRLRRRRLRRRPAVARRTARRAPHPASGTRRVPRTVRRRVSRLRGLRHPPLAYARGPARVAPIIRTVTDTCRKPVLLAGDFNMKVAKTVLDGLGGTIPAPFRTPRR